MSNDEIMQLEGPDLAKAIVDNVMSADLGIISHQWRPDRDHNAAAEVLRLMREKYRSVEFEWVISCPELGTENWDVSAFWKTGDYVACVGSLPVSICRVALLAKATLG